MFFIVLQFILIISTANAASNEPFKMGKVTADELAMKVYEKDTSADAIILGDYGHVEMEYKQQQRSV